MPRTARLKKSDMYSGPVGSLYHRCPLCPPRPSNDPTLRRCSACRAIRYCSREHQVADRPKHRYICKEIKAARADLSREEHGVRNATPDFMTPANAFETDVGDFWGVVSTRDYMRARCMLAKCLCSIDTMDGVTECLEHLQDMLRLCQTDNVGNRQIVPTVMLRLDLDQECYEFVKWWAFQDQCSAYDCDDGNSLYYYNAYGADALESPGCIVRRSPCLEHLDALLVLKLKLLVDIRSIKITRKLLARRQLPFELRVLIERDVVRSPISLKFLKEPQESLRKTEQTLLIHARRLGKTIMTANKHFMPILFDPDEALGSEFPMYSPGSWEQAALVVQNSYATWRETEGILDLLNDARACSMQNHRSKYNGATDREESQEEQSSEALRGGEQSLNDMWWYLDWAAENSAWLGPLPERPSERHMRKTNEDAEKSAAEVVTKTSALLNNENESDWENESDSEEDDDADN
ncbi:hypothetical protein NPX13_g1981 [Xylaria arbuscula]|uniref:MYND-type domain-containing protein n=1 Tax=Xylaria arbuscula TaxID=114810 RepID=A0A9W8NK06_9PEZI|nr:hypothetical protein NPX13_g1981 [Xylaria arbuscula]